MAGRLVGNALGGFLTNRADVHGAARRLEWKLLRRMIRVRRRRARQLGRGCVVADSAKSAIYDVVASDPDETLIDRSGFAAEDIAEIGELMAAFGELREAERAISEESQEYMKLNATDMRALHYLIICQHQQRVGTPGGIAEHLNISASATTKLLDRLERSDHIVREPHPSDRRAQAISITPATYTAAVDTVGRAQSRRFRAAARLSSAERQVVIRFLRDTKRDLTDPDADSGRDRPPRQEDAGA